MKFKLYEDISKNQRNKNKKLKLLLNKFKINGKKYVVHHLSSDVVSEVDQLMDNDLKNILFLPKTPNGDSNGVHQVIHGAAKFGGYDEFLKFICELNQSNDNPIYAIREVDNELVLYPIRISDAITMTMKGKY